MSDIRVGDIVRVVNTGHTYTMYKEWASKYSMNNYAGKEGVLPKLKVGYKVVVIGPHTVDWDTTVLGIEDSDTKQHYIIGIEGVEKVEEGKVKDYSHIKQGMYILKDEIKDEATWKAVVEAFGEAGAATSISVNSNYGHFKEDTDLYYGWDAEGDLHIPVGNDLGYFGEDAKLVSLDFILNGPKKEEPETFDDFVKDCIDNSKEFKVKVTNETGKLVQEAVFRNGGRWASGCTSYLNELGHLFVRGDIMTHIRCAEHFNGVDMPEVLLTPVTTLNYSIVDKPKPKTKEEVAKEERAKKIKELEKTLEELRKLDEEE